MPAVAFVIMRICIRTVEGDSAWNKRHKQGHFKGYIIPFGALIEFRPPKPILCMFPKFEKRSLPEIFLGYHLMSGERFYGDYLVAPFVDFEEPPTWGVRICRIAEIIIDKAEDYKSPLRESKDKNERSLENTGMNYTHMFDNKTEDNTPILKELDSTIAQEPTLEELNEEEDRLEFINNTTWLSLRTKEQKIIKFRWKNQYLPEAAALAEPLEKYQKFHQHQLRPELQKLKRVSFKRVGLGKRKYTPMQRPKPEDVITPW